MKKYLFKFAMSLALLTSAAAHAQTIHLQVTVPFEFGDTTLQAGEYDIQAAGPWGGKVLSIRNLSANAGAFVISMLYKKVDKSNSSELVFNRYGQQYFLAEVWGLNDPGRQMPINSRRVQLAQGQSKSEVVLMASRK